LVHVAEGAVEMHPPGPGGVEFRWPGVRRGAAGAVCVGGGGLFHEYGRWRCLVVLGGPGPGGGGVGVWGGLVVCREGGVGGGLRRRHDPRCQGGGGTYL